MSGCMTYRLGCLLKPFGKHLFLLRNLETEVNVFKSPVTISDIPKNILIQDYMLNELRKWDNKIALECVETSRSYTYLDLRKKSLALAHFLRNDLKLEEKSSVGVLLPNVPEYPIVLLGALRAGLTITTINPQYGKDEIKRQLLHSKSKALFTLSERGQDVYSIAESLEIPVISLKLNEASSLHDRTINLSEVIHPRKDITEDIKGTNVGPDDVAFLPYSSGTTGMSKGVELTHKNIVSNLDQAKAKEFCSSYEDQDEVVLAFLPFFHSYGLTLVLLHRLCQGAKLITFPKFTSQSFITGLRKYRPTYIPSVPPVVHLIINSPEIKPEDLVSVRYILSGAAPFQAPDFERFYDVTQGKTKLLQSYGMTELSPLATIQTEMLKGGVKIGGCGLLIPNTEAKFISENDPRSLTGLAPNETGELYIRGPQVMKGYLDNPVATAGTITEDGWLKTGDIGHYDEDGHIFITDRLKDLIKVKGFQVAPAELEAILRDHPSVEDVAVIGVPHSKLGEAPKAFVVTKDRSHIKPEEIQAFLAERVAKFKQLAGGVEFLDSIPKNPSGKILRRALRKST